MTRHELHEISSEFTPVDNRFGHDASTHPKKLFVSPAEAVKRGWLTGSAEEAQLRIIMTFMIDHQARLSEEAGLVEFFGLYLIGYEEECLVFWFEGGQPEFDDRPWFCNYDCTLVWLHRSVLEDPDIEREIFGKVVKKTKIGVRRKVWTEVEIQSVELISTGEESNLTDITDIGEIQTTINKGDIR